MGQGLKLEGYGILCLRVNDYLLKDSFLVRLKLVMLVSLIAALVGAGSSIAIILTRTSVHVLSSPDLVITATLVLPIAAVVLASFFVYRHTARRRKTQALLTGVLAAFLSLGIFILASIITSRTTTPTQPAPTPRNVG